MKIFVICPDKPSGDNFASSFDKYGIDHQVSYPEIAPRVIVDKINKSPKVTADFEKAIQGGVNKGFNVFAIACNTLQLWVPKLKKRMKIYTTFEAVDHYFPDKDRIPIWLGTTPLCAAMKSKRFRTLLSLNRSDLQTLTQELIWRVKAVTGAYFDKKFKIENVKSKNKLKERTKFLVDSLQKININTVILGCTELPNCLEPFR